ncbi:ABC transporter substrate-binding protein [Vibrio sp. DW001]|uniref:ABC transporter substrate-binding protein n=1 Tax=Vibrio sp. DW001 TaxID=2912315 RepID=UPI0023AFD692|nr:ABC transporter substrate-binding protein [Vibrio sp. DW001]WED27832.1 ABC transporter substrate-binding protein [Vibrio sp. DW001]
MSKTKRTFTAISAGIMLAGSMAVPSAVAKDVTLTIFNKLTTAHVRNFNPYNEISRVETTRHFIYEPLIIFNSMNNMEPHYRLATAFEYNDDNSAITMTLRQGVKWSDGQSFDADDVMFSFDLVMNNSALDAINIVEKVARVEKIDDFTVKFTLAKPSTLGLYDVAKAIIVPQHIWANVNNPVTFTNENPVGSGPLTEIKRFKSMIYEQCRNPYYWDNDNLDIDCIRAPQFASNDQALLAAQTGKLDWFGMFVAEIDKTFVARDKDNNKYWFPPNSLVFYAMNSQIEDPVLNATFNDIAFRRAFSMALDRETLRVNGANGYPTLNDDPTLLGAPYASWNDPAVLDKYKKYTTFSIDNAKAELAAAGYKDTNNDGFIETPKGEAIEFDIVVPNGWTDWINVVTLSLETLRKVGINANLKSPEATVWTSSQLNANYEVVLNATVRESNPYNYYNLLLHSEHMGIPGNRFASHRFADKELDAILDEFPTALDDTTKANIIDRAQVRVAENMPIIPVFNNPMWYEYSTKNFTGFWDGDNAKGNPIVFQYNPERLLMLLDLKPR